MNIDCTQALRDLQAVVDLGPIHRDLLETLSRLIDEGTPILQVDRSHAPSANSGVIRYKLADELQRVLAAVRARDFDTDEVESGSGHARPS
jgi:hypothetical protein